METLIETRINMETYEITFKSQDGTIDQYVWIDAYSKVEALDKFDRLYDYDEIIRVKIAD